MPRVERLRVKALLADPGDGALPELDSVVDIFPTADFQEREVYDFFGIVFRGHPDLRRILMPEDYVGWPQRRDFPVGGDPVIFTNTEDEVPGWTGGAEQRDATPTDTPEYADTTRTPEQMGRDAIGRTEAQVIGTSPIERTSLEREEELFTVNMGPHHPATHGVLRLLVSPRGRGRPRPEAGDGLRPHRDREVLRGEELLEGDPVRRADGLPLLLLQHGGVLRRRREAARARDPAAGPSTCGSSTWS